MDAIKKKMQAMKLEKDNAMDRALLCEQQARDANLRAEKVSIPRIVYFNKVILSDCVRKGRNGRELLRRLKPTVGCNASRRRRRRRSYQIHTRLGLTVP